MIARVQQRRTPGWRPPDGAASVIAGTRWANPYRVGVHAADARQALDLFVEYLARNPELVADARIMLSGRSLMCWCRPGRLCHGDLWLQVANGPC